MEAFDLASVGIRFSLMCSSSRIRPLTDKKGFFGSEEQKILYNSSAHHGDAFLFYQLCFALRVVLWPLVC